MMTLIQQLNRSLKWNAIEGILYKAILVLHQSYLFYYISSQLYGLSSLFFAMIYLMVELFNFGFDKSLAQLFSDYFEQPINAHKYLKPQVWFQIGLLGLIWVAIILGANQIESFLIHKFQIEPQTIFFWILISTTIFFESIRKTLRMLAQLCFLNRSAALLELGLISLYVLIFWSRVWSGSTVTLTEIYLPLLLQSVLGVTVLGHLVWQTLRPTLQPRPASVFDRINLNFGWKLILQTRLSNYCYQFSEAFFSSNLLVYFFSFKLGLAKVAPLKLANYFAIFLKALLEKTFGFSTLALFAQVKHTRHAQFTLFREGQGQLNLFLKILTIIFLSLGAYLLVYDLAPKFGLAWLFFGFTLINSFFIIYEQLFIIHRRLWLITSLNLLVILICWGLIKILGYQAADAYHQILFGLCLLIGLRLTSFNLLRQVMQRVFQQAT